MAMLQFMGEALKVKVTHNVISEMIRMNQTGYKEAMKLASTDPMGWIRDVTYCSLRVYNPEKLGSMSLYEVGDEIMKLKMDEVNAYMQALLEDFLITTGVNKKVASEKK